MAAKPNPRHYKRPPASRERDAEYILWKRAMASDAHMRGRGPTIEERDETLAVWNQPLRFTPYGSLIAHSLDDPVNGFSGTVDHDALVTKQMMTRRAREAARELEAEQHRRWLESEAEREAVRADLRAIDAFRIQEARRHEAEDLHRRAVQQARGRIAHVLARLVDPADRRLAAKALRLEPPDLSEPLDIWQRFEVFARELAALCLDAEWNPVALAEDLLMGCDLGDGWIPSPS